MSLSSLKIEMDGVGMVGELWDDDDSDLDADSDALKVELRRTGENEELYCRTAVSKSSKFHQVQRDNA